MTKGSQFQEICQKEANFKKYTKMRAISRNMPKRGQFDTRKNKQNKTKKNLNANQLQLNISNFSTSHLNNWLVCIEKWLDYNNFITVIDIA